MAVLSGIRAKRIAAAMLSVILFAWISVVAAQCEITAFSEVDGRVELDGRGLQYECAHVKLPPSIAGEECCCALTTVVNGDASKLPKVAMLILFSADPGPVDLAIVREPKLDLKHLSVDEHFPPVYLATQRLRI